MNANQGLLRIAQAVRWIGYAVGALIIGGGLYALSLPQNKFDSGLVILFFAPGALIMVAGKILAWIIEGFAAPRQVDATWRRVD